MRFGLKVDLRDFRRGMTDIAKRQMPFATSLALTETAGYVGLSWQDEMRERLDRPTTFTLNSVSVIPARKSRLVATVLIRDIAANYLLPFVEGGPHFLGNKRAIITPKKVPLNAYGNIPRGKIAALKAKPGVYVGPVKLKSGQVVSGVWQRKGPKGRKVGKRSLVAPAPTTGSLQLLIRFSDPLPVKQHLDLEGRAVAEVQARFVSAWTRAFARAQATAR